jgi:hypothetical protein
MATLTNTKIKDTYDGLLKTTNSEAIGASGVTLIEDGLGNASAISIGRSGNGVTITGSLNATLATAAQPNITSVGTLSSLAVAGNLTVDTNTLFVDAANNRVGIGESTPLVPLHISKNTASGENIALILDNNDTTVNSEVGLLFRSNVGSTNTDFQIATINTAANQAQLVFRSDGGAERMRITSSGRVGIGTISPSEKVQIKMSNTGELSFLESGASSTAIKSSGSLVFETNPLSNFIFQGFDVGAGATERMRIDSSGNVGIGESNPNSKLIVKNTSGSNDGIRIHTADSAEGFVIFRDDTATSPAALYYDHSVDAMWFKVNGSERMRINSSGNVGIGESSIETKLHISDSVSPPVLRLDYDKEVSTWTPGETITELQSFIGDSSGIGKRVVTNIKAINEASGSTTAAGLAFFTSASNSNVTERMRITSGGDVLISAASTASADNGIKFFGQSGSLLGSIAQSKDYSSGTITYTYFEVSSGSVVGSIAYNGSSVSYNTSSDYRLKENVVEMTGALDRVDALKPSKFNFIGQERVVDGFIAHEVQAIVPEAVTGEKDAVEEYEVTPAVLDDEGNVIEEAVMGTRPVYQGIDQSKIVPLLVGAIKELKAEIETLKSQING